MAGPGAKVIYPRNTDASGTSLGYVDYFKIYSKENVNRNMEDDVIEELRSPNLNKQLQALDDLRLVSRRNGGSFPPHKQKPVFDALARCLSDSKQDVRLLSTQLIHELIPGYGDNLDECMSTITPKLVPNLGDPTIAIRRATIQTLHVYMKYTQNMQQLLQAIVTHGLEHQSPQVRKEVIIALPMLFTPEFSQEDFFNVAHSLAKKLLDSNLGEDKVKEHILLSLDKIRYLVGDKVYNGYIQRLSTPLRKYYLKLTNNNDGQNDKNASLSIVGQRSGSDFNGRAPVAEQAAFEYAPSSANQQNYQQTAVSLKYGVIPHQVMDKLNDQTNYRTRAQAVEELKGILREMNKRAVDALSPNVLDFINYLNNLLDDSNFKITTVTLEILGILVDKFNVAIRPYLKQMIGCLTKRMGDNKIVIRQAIMKVVMQLMQILSPKPVLQVLTDNLSNRNSRTRQETLNIIIASLLTFPSYDFDLHVLCTSIAHTLVDPKRQVRQAALECFAVIAQAMGAGKLQPLVQAVDSVELSYEGDGVMAAVQARLTRRQLPKLNSDGLVDYATPVPSSGTVRGGAPALSGPDIEWILLGSGGSGSSARSYRSENLELESLASNSARSTPSNLTQESPSHGPVGRRHPSAGKNRTKLPWEEEQDNILADVRSQVKPRTTWGGEDFGNDVRRSLKQKGSGSTSNSRDGSPDNGSYQKIHRNKYHRQTSAGEPTSYSVSDSSNNTEHVSKIDNSPIPIKPALVRGVSSKRKVPPIPLDNNKDFKDEEPFESTRSNLFTDDDGGEEDDDEDDDDSDLEYKMSNSLRTIHNSASRKKIVKTVQPLDQQHTQSSTSQSSPTEDSNKAHRIKRKPDMPFETKPRIARKSNPPSPKTEHAPLSSISKSNVFNHDTKLHSEFKPHGGVTFHKNSSLEVELVGRGYNEDSQNNDTRTTPTTATTTATQHGQKNKETKKPHSTAKSVLSPLGLASLSTFGQSEVDDDWLPSGVVGRGMFEVSPHSGEHTLGSNTSWQSGQMSSQGDGNRNLPQGVYGVKVRTTSQGQDDDSEDDGDDVGSIAISKTTKERMAQKYRQKQEEAERKHANHERIDTHALAAETAQKTREMEQKKKQEELRIKREKERQQEKLRKLSNNKEEEIKGLSISGNSQHSGTTQNSPVLPSNGIGHKRTVNKNTSPPKPKTRPPPAPPEQPSHPSSAKTGEPEPTEELKAFNDPYAAYNEAMKMIGKEQWDIKYTGINNIRRLVVHHPEVLIQNLHSVNVAIVQEVKNLRSQVSRLAIVCLGEMYTYLKKHMDLDVDQIARVLLAKNGESSGFIRADVDHAMAAMVDNVTPQRAMMALINGGTSHKNVAVRKCAAYHLVSVAERMGPGRILSGVKDLTDKILPVATQFLLDPNPEVRYNGQRILYGLMSHEEFEKMMNKYVSATTLRNVKDKLEVLKKKGLTDPPSESSSARSRRSGQGVRTNSRGQSAVSDHTSQSSASSKRVVRTDEATMEEIKSMCAMMSANDWRDRQKGIQQLLDMTQYNFNAVANNVVKIFDKFIPCLKDSNSKVNLFALQAMMKLVPALKDHLAAVTPLSIQTVTSNLSSKNNDIYTAATSVLDIFMEHLDPVLLLHPFANQAQAGNARIKPDMINRVAFLTNEVYPKKPKQVILHVLPLLWHLLGSTPSSGAVPGGTGNLRSAISALVQTLYSCMGQSLLDNANNTSAVTMRMKQTLQDMVENP